MRDLRTYDKDSNDPSTGRLVSTICSIQTDLRTEYQIITSQGAWDCTYTKQLGAKLVKGTGVRTEIRSISSSQGDDEKSEEYG